ncbi:DNA alkylation repair enzyme [compost metagenome]
MTSSTSMSPEQVMAHLEGLGSESVRKSNARRGASTNQFGVRVGELRALAKTLGTDHPLGLALWATGNEDARFLATMLLDPAAMGDAELEAMVAPLTYEVLIDELVDNVVANAPVADALRERWMPSEDPTLGHAGWMLLIDRVMKKQTADLDLAAILDTIESGVVAAPESKQWAMNRCMVEIAVRHPALTERCIAIGERHGRLDNRPVPKGCYSSYAPEWIAAVLRRKQAAKR